jgi:hypothetical protein
VSRLLCVSSHSDATRRTDSSGLACGRGGNDAMYCTSRPKGHAHLCRMTPFLFVVDIAVILAAIYAFSVGTKTAIVCGAGLFTGCLPSTMRPSKYMGRTNPGMSRRARITCPSMPAGR